MVINRVLLVRYVINETYFCGLAIYAKVFSNTMGQSKVAVDAKYFSMFFSRYYITSIMSSGVAGHEVIE